MGYDWDEGKLFRHDETGLYAWVQESGCSCNEYLDHVDDGEAFVAQLDWAPLDRHITEVCRYIDGDADAYVFDANGPTWRADVARRAACRASAVHHGAPTTGRDHMSGCGSDGGGGCGSTVLIVTFVIVLIAVLLALAGGGK